MSAVPFTILDSSLPPAGQREIILTFDDGPQAQGGVSARILDVLARHQTQATFFFIGRRVVSHPELVARAAREGHQIGIHGWESGWPVWFDEEVLRREIATTRAAIEQAATTVLPDPVLYRPPKGIVTPAVDRLVDDCSLTLGHITFYARDSATASTVEAEKVMRVTRDGLLKHDGGAVIFHSSRYRPDPEEDNRVDKRWLPDALEDFIVWAQRQGFSFRTYGREVSRVCG